MPELAAHLERVARELAAAINNLDDMWLSDTFPTESVAKLLAAALAACAREAKLEEALWWEHLVGDCHGTELASECVYCEHILKLRQDIELAGERAVGESSLDPQGGQHEN